ncbi:DUF4179 domain-containing protein [Paenibacillus donghaensis]|uniref:DUF4179 domain-containing protein n=1 Tax=Paenibacillus donghaensis TaxID=414771 RepID=UPI00188468B6|nr:DUF4179 domain-containing protein [Paenibacillus donghaensis]MBE9917595.1 DUF4179 domain-containing protein [Paenibacillus donghaensis]
MKALEHEDLLQLKEEPAQELPESVRMRLDETYFMLEDMPMAEPDKRKKRSWVRRSILIVSGAAAAFMLLIGSGFVSPVMAQALKQIPFLESVFKLAGDRGLQKASDEGMTVKMDQSVTHNAVTVTLSELIYDGSRLNLVLTRDKLPEENSSGEGSEWIKRSTLGLNNIDFYVNGSWVNTGMSVRPGGSSAPHSIIVTALDSPGLHIPDEFELKLLVKLEDQPKPFEFKLPVKKAENSTIITPDEFKVLDHIQMGIVKLEITPVTTQLEVEIKGDQGQSLSEIEKLVPDQYKVGGSMNFDFDIADDKGNLQNTVGGNGSGETDHFRYVYSYEPFAEIPEFVTIKPYVLTPKTGEKKYIPELEFKIQVK